MFTFLFPRELLSATSGAWTTDGESMMPSDWTVISHNSAIGNNKAISRGGYTPRIVLASERLMIQSDCLVQFVAVPP